MNRRKFSKLFGVGVLSAGVSDAHGAEDVGDTTTKAQELDDDTRGCRVEFESLVRMLGSDALLSSGQRRVFRCFSTELFTNDFHFLRAGDLVKTSAYSEHESGDSGATLRFTGFLSAQNAGRLVDGYFYDISGRQFENITLILTASQFGGDVGQLLQRCQGKTVLLEGRFSITNTLKLPAGVTVIANNPVFVFAGAERDYTVCQTEKNLPFRLNEVKAGEVLSRVCRAAFDFSGAKPYNQSGTIHVDLSGAPAGVGALAVCSPTTGHAADSNMGSWNIKGGFFGRLGQTIKAAFTGTTWQNFRTAGCVWDHWEVGNSFDDSFTASFRAGGSPAENGACMYRHRNVFSGSSYGSIYIRPAFPEKGDYLKLGLYLGRRCGLITGKLYFEGRSKRFAVLGEESSLVCPDIKFSVNSDVSKDLEGDKSAIEIFGRTGLLDIGLNARFAGARLIDCAVKARCDKVVAYRRKIRVHAVNDISDQKALLKYAGSHSSVDDLAEVEVGGVTTRHFYDGKNHLTSVVPRDQMVYEVIAGPIKLSLNLNENIFGVRRAESYICLTNPDKMRRYVYLVAPTDRELGRSVQLIFTQCAEQVFLVAMRGEHGHFLSVSSSDRKISEELGVVQLVCLSYGGKPVWAEIFSRGVVDA